MRAATDLLSNYQHVIEDLTLITGDRGVYDVVVNDELIYSKGETGRHDTEGEVLELFAELVGPDVRRFGT